LKAYQCVIAEEIEPLQLHELDEDRIEIEVFNLVGAFGML